MSVPRFARRSGLLPRLLAATTAATALATAPPLLSTAHAAALVTSPASLVNPFIGTSNSGDTFPGADTPFGMVQWSPDTTPTRPSGGGYASGSTAISGFSLSHMSGPGCARTGVEGDIPVLPTVGAVDVTATDAFSHTNESASAGSYSVALNNGVTTKLTATARSGMAQFTFPATTQANLVFKLTGSETPDSNVQFNVVSNTEVSGQVTTGNFCGMGTSYTVYFDMVFDQPFIASGTSSSDGYVTFDTTSAQLVQAKVGLSYVSAANAVANRTAENPNWDFNGTQSAAQAAWNSVLGRVQIAGGTANQQTTFYTALYHSLLHPNVISDTNGQYPGFDGTVHTVDTGHSAVYANYSGWDIYRSQAQLEALSPPRSHRTPHSRWSTTTSRPASSPSGRRTAARPM